MTPDNNRIELMGRLLEEYNIEGVVEMTLQACHTYNIEAKSIEKFVKSKGLPYIHVETDYSQADIGQLDTRIAAFLEMIQDSECIKFKRTCPGILKKWMGF